MAKIVAKNFGREKLNFSGSALFHMKTRVSLKYFVNDSLWKYLSACNFLPDSSKLTFFDNFGNSKAVCTVLT